MIVLAVGIATFYIQPTFTEIGKTQDDILLFQEERKKVNEVNLQLAALMDELTAVPAQDQQRLLTYVPDSVDQIKVLRILQNIAAETGVLVGDISAQGTVTDVFDQAESTLVPYRFALSVEGSYSQIKQLLAILEINEFPLEVHEMEIRSIEGAFLAADFVIMTYGNELPEQSFFGDNR